MIHYKVEVDNLCYASSVGVVTFHGTMLVETDGSAAARVARQAIVVELECRDRGETAKHVFELSLPWVNVDAVECSGGLAVSAWPIAHLTETPTTP